MNWIPKQGHNATDSPAQNTSAFYRRAAVNLQFDDRDFDSDAGLIPKLPDPCRRQNGAGIADRVWTIGDLLDAALVTQPIDPIVTEPDRRKQLRAIEGGVKV